MEHYNYMAWAWKSKISVSLEKKLAYPYFKLTRVAFIQEFQLILRLYLKGTSEQIKMQAGMSTVMVCKIARSLKTI